ncbi:MAG: homoserine dehydrogenase, partial [Pseudomonadota bacterium]
IVQRRPERGVAGPLATGAAGDTTSVVLITHVGVERAVRGAVSAIQAAGDIIVGEPQLIRIEQL